MKNHLTPSVRSRIQQLTEKIAPEVVESESPEDASLEVFAHATWSGLGEPGDRLVRVLCDSMGAARALGAVVGGSGAEELMRLITEQEEFALDDMKGNLSRELGEALERWRPRLSEAEAIAHLERALRIGASIVTESSTSWPSGLADLGAHRPSALWVRGNLDTLSSLERSISVVGARASTGYGEHVTMELVSGLVENGWGIVSGAAYGIDGMAHRAALASNGNTVAVLAGGIDRLYPSGHDALLHRIIETGAVLTELPCGFAPTKWRFLQRNRLIAAMSSATVVIEAGWRSGSLNTAHHALELDRPVGVVPGPITSASSAGCHRLLRETPSVCVTTVGEIEQLAGDDTAEFSNRLGGEPVHPFASRVLDALHERTGRQPAQAAKIAGLSEPETLAVLGLLELAGSVREVPTGWVKVTA